MDSKQPFVKSFIVAFEGIWAGFIRSRNFYIQVILGVIAIIAGFIYKISDTEWILLLLAINFVLMLELINTSIESVVDLISPGIQPKAKVAKDTAVAAVLVSSIFAAIIGLIIFLPKII